MPRGIEGFRQPRQIRPHAVDPHGVGVDMEERGVAQQRQRLHHGAAGAQHLVALIRDDHAGPAARLDVIDDLVGQIMHIDHGLADAGVAELVEHMIEQRLPATRTSGFGICVGQGTHAHAETGGEDHGFGGLDGHFWKFLERLLLRTAIISRRFALSAWIMTP